MVPHNTPPHTPVWCPQPPPAPPLPRPPAAGLLPLPRPHNKHFQSPGQNGSKNKYCNGAPHPRSDISKQHRFCRRKPDDSPVMQEFHKHRFQFEVEDICDHVLEFAKDQDGSRFIQQKLECVDADDKQMVFDELAPEIYPLMNHKYGNYIIQKFFELGSNEQKIILVEKLQGNVLYLTLQLYGCRVVEKAIETLSPELQVGLKKVLARIIAIVCYFDNIIHCRLKLSVSWWTTLWTA